MDLATMMATAMDTASTPALFNLVDLIQGNLRSQSQQTVSVTLQLVSIILRRHHRYAVTTLLWTSQVVQDRPMRSLGAHEKEMDFLLGLAGDVGGDCDFDEVYEDHMKDCMGILESHPCSITLVAPKSPGGTNKLVGSSATIAGAPRDIRLHTLRPEDPMLNTMMEILGNFFTNSVEVNLSLTGSIVDLATCGYMRIDGWLLPDPSKYVYEEEEEDDPHDPFMESHLDPIEIQERAQLRALKNARRNPKWTASQFPPILQKLQLLADQVATYRTDIPRFTDLYNQRRGAFQAAASTTATPVRPRSHQPSQSHTPSPSRSISPPRNAFDALAHRMFPDLATPSRSRSPRSRDRGRERSSGSLSGGYGLATPTTNINLAIPPPQFPMAGFEAPVPDSTRGYSSSPLRTADEHAVPASQAAAFAAVDQSILARRVGLPAPKHEIKAIPFPNLRDGAADASGESSVDGGSVVEDKNGDKVKTVSVSHVLTNVVVLQEFLLELAALVQVRAGLFGEVRFV